MPHIVPGILCVRMRLSRKGSDKQRVRSAYSTKTPIITHSARPIPPSAKSEISEDIPSTMSMLRAVKRNTIRKRGIKAESSWCFPMEFWGKSHNQDKRNHHWKKVAWKYGGPTVTRPAPSTSRNKRIQRTNKKQYQLLYQVSDY